jgi:predicted HTH transcriptional regulator
MPIDTLKAARRLQEEDTFDEDQAERIAEVMSDFGAASATKEDLNELEERLRKDMEAMEERLTRRIDEVEKQTKKELRKELETAEERIKRTLTNHIYAAAGVLAAVVTLLNYVMG